MCVGVPGRITATAGDVATVDVAGTPRRVSLVMLPDGAVDVGSWVVIHMGFALEVLDEDVGAPARPVMAGGGGGGD